MSWKAEQHSDDENLRWTLLRAIEWKEWPLFVSLPIIPVLICFYPWFLVIGGITIITFVWWLIVAPRFTPSTIIDLSVYFVWLKFVTSPLMAYHIWQSGRPWTAALALSWPFAGYAIVSWLLMWPQALLASTERAKAAQIGVIQQRLMGRLGYIRQDI
jgi:hypothetical protein